jgi:putative phage-type endonuclease
MLKHNVLPNTPDWLELRTRYRTASEAAIVLGISPFTSIKDFKLIKAGLKKQYYSKAMQLGHELEDTVRQWANDKLNKNFTEEIWTRDEYLASLDGIDGDTLVEIKVSSHTHAKLPEVPPAYMAQIQQQLYCSPATTGYLVAYCPKTEAFKISDPITQDESFMGEVSKAWAAFDALPIPDVEINMDGERAVIDLFEEYERLKLINDSNADRMKEIKNSLVELSHSKGLEADGYKLTKKAGAIRIDYKKAASDAKLDLEPYTKTGEPSFSITLKRNPFK